MLAPLPDLDSLTDAERRRLAAATHDTELQRIIADFFPQCWEALALNRHAAEEVIARITYLALRRQVEMLGSGIAMPSEQPRIVAALQRNWPEIFSSVEANFGHFDEDEDDDEDDDSEEPTAPSTVDQTDETDLDAMAEPERRRLAATTHDDNLQSAIADLYPSCWEALILNRNVNESVIEDIIAEIFEDRALQLGDSPLPSDDYRVVQAIRRLFPKVFIPYAEQLKEDGMTP